MSRNENQMGKLPLWTMAALIAPLAHWAGAGYPAVALAVLTTIPLTLLSGNRMTEVAKPMAVLQCIWAAAVLAHLLPASGAYWTGGGKTVHLTLLTLGALAGSREKAARAGNTLFWLILPVLGIVMILGSRKLEPEWLRPEPGMWSAELLIVLLLPSILSQATRHGRSGALPVALIAMLLSVLLQGTLSGPVAASVQAPLYEVGRTIGGGGEIIVSVGMTLSWYALCSGLFETASAYAGEIGIAQKWGRGLIWIFTAGMILLDLQIPGIVLLAGSVILWILVPLLPVKK